MKIAKNLIAFLVFILAVVCLGGCSHLDKTDVKTVISTELNLLKNLDPDTAQKYVSYKELFPDATKETTLSREIKEVFSLFFQNFDYQILDIDVDENNKEAVAKVKLTTIDAETLASDYAKASLKAAVLKAAGSVSDDTEQTTDSLEDRYVILDDLLKQNQYETVEKECTLTLTNKGASTPEWEIVRTHSLENDLVGGLFSDALQQTGGKIIADALQCGRHDLLPMIDLKLKPVFSVLPLSIHLDLHRIRLRQFDANGGKADQVVMIAIGASGLCGYAAVLRFHPKDRIFAGRIEKQYLVQCCNNAHSTSPPFPFTLPAKQLFSHGIFAIQTP